MKRVEIFINQSIEEDLIEKLADEGFMKACTRWTPVFGNGNAGPREGTATWPEKNSGFLLFMKNEQIDTLKEIVSSLKKTHPREGLKCFISNGPDEIL
jgi:nitrogen regulatory protein PII